MDKTTHSCKRYRQKRDSWVGQKPNTTSKPPSVGNLKSSLLEAVPLFIPAFFHTARKHLQKGPPGGQYPFSLPRKKHTNASTMYTTIPYNHSVHSPTHPGDLSEGAGDEGKQRADYVCSLSIWSHEKFAVSIPAMFWVWPGIEERSSREGRENRKSLEAAGQQGRVFPRLFYFWSSFFQSSAIGRTGQTSDNLGPQVSVSSSGSGKIIQKSSNHLCPEVTWNTEAKISSWPILVIY